jgi:hypothetical protein
VIEFTQHRQDAGSVKQLVDAPDPLAATSIPMTSFACHFLLGA